MRPGPGPSVTSETMTAPRKASSCHSDSFLAPAGPDSASHRCRVAVSGRRAPETADGWIKEPPEANASELGAVPTKVSGLSAGAPVR